MTLYNPNKDLVDEYVYTKFGFILSIRFQDIEKQIAQRATIAHLRASKSSKYLE